MLFGSIIVVVIIMIITIIIIYLDLHPLFLVSLLKLSTPSRFSSVSSSASTVLYRRIRQPAIFCHLHVCSQLLHSLVKNLDQ